MLLFGLFLLSFKTAVIGHIGTNDTSTTGGGTARVAETSQSDLTNTLVDLTSFVSALTGLILAIAGLVKAIKPG